MSPLPTAHRPAPDPGSTTVPGVLAGGGPWEGLYTGDTVLPAFEGRLLTPTSPVFWEYRFNASWNRHAIMGGREGGTNGC